MGATLAVNENASEMIRLVNGKLVQETSQRNLYVVPPKGEYQWEITGYALPFEMEKGEQFGGGKQTLTRLEFTITEGKGTGKMFTVMFGFSIGERSNLGQLLRSLNVDLSPDDNGQWDLDRAVGYRGKGYVVPSDKLGDDGKPKYCKLALDTIDPVSAPDKPYSITIVEPAEIAASNGHANGNGASDNDGWE